MIDETQVEQLLIEHGSSEEAKKMIRLARSGNPISCDNRLGTSIISFFSRKMGSKHLELQSRTVAAPAATMYEYDAACLEYWPRPFYIDLTIIDEKGNSISRQRYIPGFLVIRSDGIYVHDWKDESDLIGKAAKSGQYFKDGDGRWHNSAAERYFKSIGLAYELRSTLEFPRTYIENIMFLEDYRSTKCPELPESIKFDLIKLISERGSVPFLELVHDHSFSADHIFTALVKKVVFADLFNQRLHVASDLLIFKNEYIAKAHQLVNSDINPILPLPGFGKIAPGAKLSYDGKEFEVMLVGGGNVLLRGDGGKRLTLRIDDVVKLFTDNEINIVNEVNNKNNLTTLAELSHAKIEKALTRWDILTSGCCDKVSRRTIDRWKESMSVAVSTLDKIILLTDNNDKKGNRSKRLPDIVESLAEHAIRTFYNTSEGRTATAAYYLYKQLCEENQVIPMSYPTFTKRVKSRGSMKDREGKRKAYQESHIPLYLDYNIPVHGVYPHEVCYIDHTVMNVATIGPKGTELGKPIFTHAVDGNTTQSRAFFLGYDPPSAKVVLLTLRDYVRRNNRLPKILVVDGGKEFRSNELKLFCRLYEIDIRHRPSGKCRGGSPVERSMGTTESEVIAQMVGNTRIMKNARMVTKSVNPFPKASWTLTALHGALDSYLFDIREERLHPTLGLTPKEYERVRFMETGQREHNLIRFDQNIMLITCPHTKNKFHKIDLQRGVWADNAYYWNDEFKIAKKNEAVEVRVEPWCANVVYVYFRDHWIAAIHRDLRPYQGRTSREVELAIRTERGLAKVNAAKDRLRDTNSKKMRGICSPDVFDTRIGEQQREMAYLYNRLGMGVAIPGPWQVKEISDLQAVNSSPDLADNPVDALEEIGCNSSGKDSDDDFWGDIDGYY